MATVRAGAHSRRTRCSRPQPTIRSLAKTRANVSGSSLASFNVTSLTDGGAGVVTVTIATDFTDANWAAFCSIENLDATIDAAVDGQIVMVAAAGIAAGVVQNAADLACDPQLDHRGQAVFLEHPEVGVQRYDAPAFQLTASPAELHPVPMLGQHNARVFQGLLGLSDTEYEALEREGVFE